MYFWVGRCSTALGRAQLDEELKSALDARVGPGKTHPNLAWWKLVDRLRNWGEEEALLELYRESTSQRYRRDLADRLVEICYVTSSVLDRQLAPGV